MCSVVSSNKAAKTAPKGQLSDDVADDHHEGNAHKRQRCFQRHNMDIVPSPELSNDGDDLAKSPADGKQSNVIARRSSAPYTLLIHQVYVRVHI